MGFLDLPSDLILLLTAHLECMDEINALCCTNRWLHELLNPVLYRCSTTTSRNGGYTLEWAARRGEVSTARLILQAGAPPDACGGEQWQPFALAAIHGHIEIIRLLLDHGVDPCSINNNWTNQNWKRPQFHPGQNAEAEDHLKKSFQKEGHPLSLAASSGQITIINLLLQYGVPPDLRSIGDEKHRALHLAARNGHFDIVRILVDAGSPIDAQTGSGFTPLTFAAEKGHLDIVQFLLEHRADPNIPSSSRSTSLSQASISGNIGIIRCLFDHGATLTPSYPNSQEPIYQICYAAERGYDEIVDLFLGKYDYVQSSTKAYQRVILLCVAAMTGRTTLLTDLLQQHNYDPNIGLDPRLPVFRSYSAPAFPHRRPQAAISWAAAYNQVTAIEILISNGASIAPPNRDFPLICAIQRGHKDAVKTLLAHGMNPNDPPGEALDQAIPNPSIFSLLLSYNADPNNSLPNIRMPWNVVLSGQVDTLCILLDHPKGLAVVADPISESSCREGSLTPLFQRALRGGEQVFRVLLGRGLLAKPKELSGSNARSALTDAIRGGSSFARLLLDMGFDATADKMGFVYHCASNHKDPDDLLDLFLQNGCSIDDMDARGRTAFFAAAQVGNVRCMQQLLKKGADLRVACWSETPLSVAAKEKHLDAVKVVLQAFDELGLHLDEVEGMLKKAEEHALKASQTDILKALRRFHCRRLYPVRA